MSRKSSSAANAAIGERLIAEVWGCFDTHVKEFGKPDENNNFHVKVNVTSANNMVTFRFDEGGKTNKVFAFSSVEKPNAEIAVICLDDDEIIMTYEEAQNIFSAFGF